MRSAMLHPFQHVNYVPCLPTEMAPSRNQRNPSVGAGYFTTVKIICRVARKFGSVRNFCTEETIETQDAEHYLAGLPSFPKRWRTTVNAVVEAVFSLSYDCTLSRQSIRCAQ